MKLGHNTGEIKFDATFGTIARYVVVLEDEPTFYILCDSADPDKTIRIAAQLDAETLTSDTLDLVSQATKGHFRMITKFTEDADGAALGVEERVESRSVYTYVKPRLTTLLGRLLRTA